VLLALSSFCLPLFLLLFLSALCDLLILKLLL
jgi:hypothetical protein